METCEKCGTDGLTNVSEHKAMFHPMYAQFGKRTPKTIEDQCPLCSKHTFGDAEARSQHGLQVHGVAVLEAPKRGRR